MMSDVIRFKDYLNEVNLKSVKIVRDGKTMIVKRCLNNDGSDSTDYKKVGDECVKMSQHEKIDRAKGSKISARHRANQQGRINTKREKSMKKRTWDV